MKKQVVEPLPWRLKAQTPCNFNNKWEQSRPDVKANGADYEDIPPAKSYECKVGHAAECHSNKSPYGEVCSDTNPARFKHFSPSSFTGMYVPFILATHSAIFKATEAALPAKSQHESAASGVSFQSASAIIRRRCVNVGYITKGKKTCGRNVAYIMRKARGMTSQPFPALDNASRGF